MHQISTNFGKFIRTLSLRISGPQKIWRSKLHFFRLPFQDNEKSFIFYSKSFINYHPHKNAIKNNRKTQQVFFDNHLKIYLETDACRWNRHKIRHKIFQITLFDFSNLEHLFKALYEKSALFASIFALWIMNSIRLIYLKIDIGKWLFQIIIDEIKNA